MRRADYCHYSPNLIPLNITTQVISYEGKRHHSFPIQNYRRNSRIVGVNWNGGAINIGRILANHELDGSTSHGIAANRKHLMKVYNDLFGS
jgi:hypothetical protein